MGEQTIVTALLMLLTGIATVVVQWMRKDETAANASLAVADKDATLVNAITALVGSVTKLSAAVNKREDRIDGLESEARELRAEITVLKQSDVDKDVTIERIKLAMADLVESNISKDKEIKSLNKQIESLRSERRVDRARITTLENEREQLLADIDKMRKKLNDYTVAANSSIETDETQTVNGNKETENTDNSPETVEKESSVDTKTIVD